MVLGLLYMILDMQIESEISQIKEQAVRNSELLRRLGTKSWLISDLRCLFMNYIEEPLYVSM